MTALRSRARRRTSIWPRVAPSASDVADALDLTDGPAGLIGRISVVQPIDTVLIKITAQGSSPLDAQRLADAWVAALSDAVDAIEDPSGGGKALRVVPIESAELPSAPVSPNIPRNLCLAWSWAH